MKRIWAVLAITAACMSALRTVSSFAPATSKVPGPRKLLEAEAAALPPEMQSLLPLHHPLGEPRPGDWLEKHAEFGENYREFLAAQPVRATPARHTLYIQPLGEFTVAERKIVELTGDFLGRFFQLPVKINDDLPLSRVPSENRRDRSGGRAQQIQSSYVLGRVLAPQLPGDAAALIALTTSDLYPDEEWNYVFGQASLAERVGVWSMHRFGDPSGGEEAFRFVLRRTLRIAAHETGHMFSIRHCLYFDCAMNTSNHVEEADRQPLWYCPQCLAKLCEATGADPRRRFEQLIEFAREQQLDAERDFWKQSSARLGER